MEGGGKESFILGDIGEYSKTEDVWPIVFSSLICLDAVIGLSRFAGLGGITLNAFFDIFGLEAVLTVLSKMTILLLVTRWAYTTFYMVGDRRWSPFVFICFALLLQTLHDLFMNFVVLSNMPNGKNDMVDLLKKYAQENGSRAFVGHSVFLIFVCVIAMFLKETTTLFTVIVVAFAIWLLPLMLSSVGPKPPPPPPPPEKKKTVEDNWNGSRFQM
jgi:hypothetical protein